MIWNLSTLKSIPSWELTYPTQGMFESLEGIPIIDLWLTLFIYISISYSSSQSDTLPETNSSHLKMDGWNTGFPFGTRPIFQVANWKC